MGPLACTMEGKVIVIEVFRRMVHKLLKEANIVMDNEVGQNKNPFWPNNAISRLLQD
jgi:hypothetical protein